MNTILSVGKNIKKFRNKRQITQQQLAESIGISYQAISKWERGKTTPDIALLPAIAEYFDVLIDELFKLNMAIYRSKAIYLLALYENEEPNNPRSYDMLAEAYRCAGSLENAKTTAEQGLAKFPGDAILLHCVGYMHKELGGFETAKSYWSKAFEADNELIDAQYSMAYLLQHQKFYGEAREVWNKIIEWLLERGQDGVELEHAKSELSKLEGLQ